MLLSTYIEIKIHRGNSKYYKNKNYQFNFGDIISIKIDDLPKGSNIEVDCKCDYCGIEKKIKYIEYNRNIKKYNKFSCSVKCSYDKIKQTNLEKYGVDNPFKSTIVKDKIKQTNLEKYGVDNPSKSTIVKDKIKQTNLEKYGVDSHNSVDEIKNKKKETNRKKYNSDYFFSSDLGKNKIKQSNLEKYGVDNIFKKKEFIINNLLINKRKIVEKYLLMINNNEYNYIDFDNEFIFHHKNCFSNFKINRQNLYDRIRCGISLCTNCYPINEQKSIKEKELFEWLKEYNIEFIENDRSILDGKELDIYIPSKNIAIEFNGLYYHSEYFKDKNYHLEKSLKCQEKGIQLLHIWEDEWVFKQDIIKSIILNKLGLIKEKVYARQCIIKPVEDSKLIKKFLDENHIQGYVQSSIKLGLFKDDELVSLMTFGYRHTNSKKEFELIRFCNKINTNIVGASSKLFKYFKSNYEFNELISYSDFRLFDGKMYQTLGFTKQHLSLPDYFWCNSNLERKHRFNFNKQKLIKEGYDSTKTEVEIMNERGYFRVWGCGQYKWYIKKSLF